MELTLLGTVALAAFLIGGGAVMLVSAFRRTVELRAALLVAIKRIERLEKVVAGSALPPPAESPALLPAPAAEAEREPTLEEFAQIIDADDKMRPPPLLIVSVAAGVLAFAALASAHMQWLAGQAGVFVAALIGAAQIGASEWRRRAIKETPSWRSAAALGATFGLVIMLVAALYGRWLLGALTPPGAFFFTAAMSLGGVALATLWYGPLPLVFALIAGVIAPGMAPIGADGTWPHYAFLFLLTATAASFARRRASPVWGWLAFAHALFWAGNAAWIGGAPGNISSEGLYIAGLAALGFLHAWDERGDALPFPLFWRARRGERLGVAILVTCFAAIALTVLAIRHQAPVANAGSGLVAFTVFAIAAAGTRAHLWFAPMLAALAATAAIALWPVGANNLVDAPSLLILAAALGLLSSLGGWGAMVGRDPLAGACIASLAPLFVFAAAYVRVGDFGSPPAWAGSALILAVIHVVSYLQLHGAHKVAAAPFAAGTAIAVVASLTAIMPAPYGPLAMAGGVLLIALADRLRDEPGFRAAGILLALALTARLVLPEIYITTATDPARVALLFIPSAVACLAAAFVFSHPPSRIVATQSIATIGLVIAAACASLAARHVLTSGSIGNLYASLVEAGINSLVWLGAAALLARMFGARPALFASIAEALIFAAVAIHALIICGVLINPWWGLAPAATPGWNGLNVIELAFAAPGVLFMFYALIRERQDLAARASGALCIGLSLLFIALVLEIRRMFHGADMAGADVTGAEAWAYSGAALAFAALLVAISAERGGRLLRFASLALVLLAFGKMAFSDVVSLSGAARVITFVAVALAAGGAVFFYRRFILPPGAARPKTLDPNLAPPTS